MYKISDKNNKPSVWAPGCFEFFKQKICFLINFESFYKLVYSTLLLQNQCDEGSNDKIYEIYKRDKYIQIGK